MIENSDIGKNLQKAREKKNLSLKEVAHETCIPIATLEALEKNDYSSFTSATYTKSFLEQYSDYLRIDAHEILENFKTGNVLDQSDGIQYLDQTKASASPKITPLRKSPAAVSQNSGNHISQPLLITLITVGLIGLGIWGFIVVEKKLNTDPSTSITAASDPSPAPSDLTQGKQNSNTPLPAQNSSANSIKNTTPAPVNQRPARSISSIKSRSTDPSSPSPLASSEDPPDEGPVYIFPEHKPAPRAIIINEDEDQ